MCLTQVHASSGQDRLVWLARGRAVALNPLTTNPNGQRGRAYFSTHPGLDIFLLVRTEKLQCYTFTGMRNSETTKR
jgi:hypothetical protein